MDLSNLTLSISNLIDEFGTTESPLVALLINTALAAVGVAAAIVADGWVAYLGIVWAIINLSGIVKWVFNL